MLGVHEILKADAWDAPIRLALGLQKRLGNIIAKMLEGFSTR